MAQRKYQLVHKAYWEVGIPLASKKTRWRDLKRKAWVFLSQYIRIEYWISASSFNFSHFQGVTCGLQFYLARLRREICPLSLLYVLGPWHFRLLSLLCSSVILCE